MWSPCELPWLPSDLDDSENLGTGSASSDSSSLPYAGGASWLCFALAAESFIKSSKPVLLPCILRHRRDDPPLSFLSLAREESVEWRGMSSSRVFTFDRVRIKGVRRGRRSGICSLSAKVGAVLTIVGVPIATSVSLDHFTCS